MLGCSARAVGSLWPRDYISDAMNFPHVVGLHDVLRRREYSSPLK